MAQLPPKAPIMAQKWPSFAYQTMPMPSSASQPPTWMDDFIDFSSARRNSHRRSTSDPIAFIEAPPFINECRNSHVIDKSLMPCSNNNGFERLDDEQLSSMFSDDFTANLQSTRLLSMTSDQNSDDDEAKPTQPPEQQPQQLKHELGEVEDGGDYEQETESVKPHITFSSDGGTVVDPKRVKRILANRQSAQRSRVRKLHYISELERNGGIDTIATCSIFGSSAIDFKPHQEALKKEIERLRRVYHEQNMKKAETTTATTTGSPA
ncbi:Basic-leucine zipper domain-containing protein [Cynara cardunculus var. scolymus]|uniref:Basic-leucine zipper domain-containing protein n=1 Tax=Cynara cardunculus var. scolymus TaxID=59895 RepID=A0A103Y458_CYNCS|nr:Basic-leucine zipper domain-containing protein [Cynara cardunculus var. scolymus]